MSRRLVPPALVLAALAAAGVVLSGSASGSNGFAFGQNVDPTLASTVAASPAASFHVLVFGGGPGLNGRNGNAYGIKWRELDSSVGAQSATVTASQLAVLSADNSVQYVTPDTPMAPTSIAASTPAPPAPPAPPAGPGHSSTTVSGSTLSSSSLATLYPQIDGATPLWSQGFTEAGVGIAIIDSGVTPRADFGSRLVQVALPTPTTRSPRSPRMARRRTAS